LEGVLSAAKVLLEFLASLGPLGNFFFGFTASKLLSMVEGMQLIAMYPLMLISGPTNLGMLQAVLRKISTWELIDGDIMKKDVWGFNVEEKDVEHF
jgi:hypothetical protein